LPASHIELMASRLEDCRSGKIRPLVINLPPRSLKSHSVSIAFVAWRRRVRDSGRSALAYAPQVGCSFAGYEEPLLRLVEGASGGLPHQLAEAWGLEATKHSLIHIRCRQGRFASLWRQRRSD
jgi:hypothetical protein